MPKEEAFARPAPTAICIYFSLAECPYLKKRGRGEIKALTGNAAAAAHWSRMEANRVPRELVGITLIRPLNKGPFGNRLHARKPFLRKNERQIKTKSNRKKDNQ